MPSYVVLQVVLKEKFIGKGSQNLSELENTINRQGFGGGDRIQATLVFESL